MTAKNDYLVKKMLAEQQKEQSAKRALQIFDKFKHHPVLGYVIFAAVLVLLQVLAKEGMISTSFIGAVGSTLIYCIVGLGFCLLLGKCNGAGFRINIMFIERCISEFQTAGYILHGSGCSKFRPVACAQKDFKIAVR